MSVGKRQRPQQDCVHHAEDCRVGGDAEGQDQHGNDGEPAIFAQRAQGIAKILRARAPEISTLHVAVPLFTHQFAGLPHSLQIAEQAFRLTPGGIPLPTLRDQLVHFGIEVEAEFVVHIGRRIGAEQARIAAPLGDSAISPPPPREAAWR